MLEDVKAEIQKFGEAKSSAPAWSYVPAHFVPERSTEEAREAALEQLLRTQGSKAKKQDDESVELPELGDAVSEFKPGFWCMSYPELFPFGRRRR